MKSKKLEVGQIIYFWDGGLESKHKRLIVTKVGLKYYWTGGESKKPIVALDHYMPIFPYYTSLKVIEKFRVLGMIKGMKTYMSEFQTRDHETLTAIKAKKLYRAFQEFKATLEPKNKGIKK